MSFAREVKKELLTITLEEENTDAFIYGALQGISEVVLSSAGMKVVLQTHLPQLLRYLLPHLKLKYQIEPSIRYYEKSGIKKSRIYVMELVTNAKAMVDEMQLLPWTDAQHILPNFINDSAISFVRGSFVAKGSISDPKKSNYHLEILFREYALALQTQKILKKNWIEAKIIDKNNQHLLYIKKAEDISSFLALIQANSGVFYFEDSRILRDLNNSVNRIMNCDIANGNKSLRYCLKQLDAIKFLEEKGFIAKMSPRLQDAIKLRKEYKDSSLAELSEFSSNILGKHMSKSGVSHCLTEVMRYYEKVVEKSDNIGKIE